MTNNAIAIQNGVLDVFLAFYTAMAATVFASNPMTNLYNMFTVLASTSKMDLHMFLYKFHQIIPIMNTCDAYMCTYLSCFDEQFELFITHRQNVGTQ